MEDRNVYVENYLRFMQSVNTGSKHTLDAYTRDIFEFLAFLDAESIARLTDLGVDYVSSGALTHSAPIMDLSLKNLHAV